MSQTPKKAAEKLIGHTEKFVRGTLLGASSRIIEDTPVDTGLLRANWQATVDSYPTNTVFNRGGQAAMSEAADKALTIKLGSTFYLTNNIVYAGFVELQRGMVKKEISRLSSKLGAA